MSKLSKALIKSGNAEKEEEANDIIYEMSERVKYGEDIEEILDEYGFNYEDDGYIYSDFVNEVLSFNKENKPSPTKDEEKMMFKIKALLDKAESTDSQEEKDAFMIKAQELIQKHNLSVSRIVGMKGEKKNGVIVNEAIIELEIKYDEEWDRQLICNISKGNFCKIIMDSMMHKVCVIGKESNCNMIPMLCDFYRKAILNLAIESAKRKSAMAKTLLSRNGKKIKYSDLDKIARNEQENINDYLFGAVNGLKDSLEKKDKEFEVGRFQVEDGEFITGKEIMVVNTDRIQEYINTKYEGMLSSFRGGSGGNTDSASYARGYSDGGGLGASQKRLG